MLLQYLYMPLQKYQILKGGWYRNCGRMDASTISSISISISIRCFYNTSTCFYNTKHQILKGGCDRNYGRMDASTIYIQYQVLDLKS